MFLQSFCDFKKPIWINPLKWIFLIQHLILTILVLTQNIFGEQRVKNLSNYSTCFIVGQQTLIFFTQKTGSGILSLVVSRHKKQKCKRPSKWHCLNTLTLDLQNSEEKKIKERTDIIFETYFCWAALPTHFEVIILWRKMWMFFLFRFFWKIRR